MTINEKIFSIMERKNIKAQDLAELLNINKSVISNWKRRGNDPPSTYLVQICKLLGTTPNELLEFNENDFSISDEEKQIIEKYRMLDEESKQAFKVLMQIRATRSAAEDPGKSYQFKTG